MFDVYHGMYNNNCYCRATYSDFCKNYWERSLFQRLRTLFNFSGLPDGEPGQVAWDKDAFLYGLFRCGFLVVFESKTYGVVIQPATPQGIGLQFQPTGMMVATPYFSFTRPLEIGTECAVLKLTPDYRGVWDIIEKYASELQLMDIAIRQSQINARFSYAYVAKNDQDANTIKAIMDKIANAEPGVIVNNKLVQSATDKTDIVPPWFQFDRDLSKNFILPELLEARRTSLTNFYHEIGVRTIPEKKERYISSEVNSYDAETYNRREVWNISLQESIKIVNEMYNLNISCDYVEPGGEEDATQPIDVSTLATRGNNRTS